MRAMSTDAVTTEHLGHVYGERPALRDVSFRIGTGEIFGLLGPNGGGKTTVFKILSTLMRPTAGVARVFSDSVIDRPAAARRHLGVVFQHPSLDRLLTVAENLLHHGHLYGMRGADLRERSADLLARLGLAERARDRVATLSGGLQRRAELAKALLHRPPLLLLDEPSTGLDPAARRDFMQYLRQLRDQEGVTVVLTTHYMEEAERCDRIALLHRGALVRVETPAALKGQVGGDVIVVHSQDPAALKQKVSARFACDAAVVDGTLRIERSNGHELLRDLVAAFPDEVTHVTYGKPTLEDVFIHLTGHQFWAEAEHEPA
jgi:ABC-2 type transport system ATP-binding protein